MYISVLFFWGVLQQPKIKFPFFNLSCVFVFDVGVLVLRPEGFEFAFLVDPSIVVQVGIGRCHVTEPDWGCLDRMMHDGLGLDSITDRRP